ncbi:phosphoribosyl transferase domain containing protein [Synechococcus sp. A18-46.1]|nr:phosphoribosyl transferase domain containing protein [Synechococcus sp. A18-46.1]
MRLLSWQQFDDAVALLAVRARSRDLTGVYGVPRGGLCLAVALSHAMDLPLLQSPEPDALVVDDVYETGRTLETLRLQFPQASFAVWVSKTPPLWWHAAEVVDSPEWLLFPWENADQAMADEQAYRSSRRCS